MGSKKSFSCGTIQKCPKCGRVGQLKQRINVEGTVFYQVDHWLIGNSHSSGYDCSCYLRTATEKERKLSPKRSEERHKIRLTVVGVD